MLGIKVRSLARSTEGLLLPDSHDYQSFQSQISRLEDAILGQREKREKQPSETDVSLS